MNRSIAESTHGRDAVAMLESGLATGISPGFRLPPQRAVAQSEIITDEEHKPEEGKHRAIIRTILEALLYELSVVTRPAYPTTQVELRNWSTTDDSGALVVPKHLRRWRA